MNAITIITVVKNHEIGLERTISSVLDQEFRDWELLIVVGESVDKTKLISRAYVQLYDNIKVIDQIGNGIYEAMNQGLKLVNSKFVWFLNAGDVFYDSNSLSLGLFKAQELEADIVIGGHSVQGQENTRTYVYSEKRLRINQFAFTRRGSCHQSMIYKTETLKKIKGFNTEYLICSDFESVLKILLLGKVFRVQHLFSSVEPGGGADKNIEFVMLERQRVRRKILTPIPSIFMGVPWTLLAIAKIKLKRSFVPPRLSRALK